MTDTEIKSDSFALKAQLGQVVSLDSIKDAARYLDQKIMLSFEPMGYVEDTTSPHETTVFADRDVLYVQQAAWGFKRV